MSRLRTSRPAIAGLLAAATASLMLAIPTAAASQLPSGTLFYGDCVARTADHGCQENPDAPINPNRMAVSQDGQSLYVTSRDGTDSLHGSVLRFVRDNSNGQIAYAGCLADDDSQGCQALDGDPLGSPFDVAVSPDGKSVYVISIRSDSITHFLRDTSSGRLIFAGCLAKADADDGCQDLPGTHFNGPFQVAVSPDGRSVYVTALATSSISHFFRDTTTGALSFDNCLARATTGCTSILAVGIDSSEVVVSPDNQSVYVSGVNAVLHFSRTVSTGQIAYAGCWSNDGSNSLCAELPGNPLRDTIRMAVPADNMSLYAVSSMGTIIHFFRNPNTGGLKFERCLGNHPEAGCQPLQNPVLNGAFDVVASPDSKSVYVVAQSGSIVHFTRNTTASQVVPRGRIAFKACLANTADLGCQPIAGQPFGTPISVATSPDGKSVYVVSSVTDTIAHFHAVVA